MKSYYSPEPEEFHIGFEYEREVRELDWYTINLKEELVKNTRYLEVDEPFLPTVVKWIPSIYKFKDPITNTRVKYLDVEDVESLGVTLEEIPDGFDWEYNVIDKNGFIIGCFLETINEPNIQFHDVWFTIKNKSELKTLLKWLQII